MSLSKRQKSDKSIKETPGVYDIPERFEMIEGIRYDFLSSPKVIHQRILTNLHLGFHGACQQEGEIFLAPLDVHLDEHNIVQPDVFYIANENLSIVRDDFIYGAPDMVVEILSKSTGQRDKTIKKSLYEKFGINEYWIVDPAYHIVEQFVLQNNRYQLFATLTGQDTVHSPVIPYLAIDLSTVFPHENLDDRNEQL